MHRLTPHLLLLVFVPLAAAGCATFPRVGKLVGQSKIGEAFAQRRLNLARQHEKEGQCEAVDRSYQSVLAINPDHPVAHHRLGLLAAKRANYGDAAEHLQAAIKAGSPSADLLSDLGFVLYMQDRLDEAETHLRAALKSDPTHARARNNLGLVLGNQGRLQESLAMFTDVVGADKAYANLAFVCTQLGDADMATACYNRSLHDDETTLPAPGQRWSWLADRLLPPDRNSRSPVLRASAEMLADDHVHREAAPASKEPPLVNKARPTSSAKSLGPATPAHHSAKVQGVEAAAAKSQPALSATSSARPIAASRPAARVPTDDENKKVVALVVRRTSSELQLKSQAKPAASRKLAKTKPISPARYIAPVPFSDAAPAPASDNR
jgi:Tfp pilus assembly protein PilF